MEALFVGPSQSPVLPRTQRAYEAHLNAGSTAVPPIWSPHPELHELLPIPMERIAKNAVRALKLASLIGFAQVISHRRV
jgi:hypothetical protein